MFGRGGKILRTAQCTAILLSLGACLAGVCLAQAVSVQELIEHAREFDRTTVVFEGEVIGDIMMRGDHAWLNLRDAEAVLGVWVSRQQAASLRYAGGFGVSGDRVRVSGVFHRICPEHGGDMDIHARTLEVLSPGKEIPSIADPGKKKIALQLLGVLAVIWILSLLRLR